MPDPIIVYISHQGGEVRDLQDLVDGREVELDWVGQLNGEDVPIKVRLAEVRGTDRTYTVGLPVVVTVAADGTVDFEVDTSEAPSGIAEDWQQREGSDITEEQMLADVETVRRALD